MKPIQIQIAIVALDEFRIICNSVIYRPFKRGDFRLNARLPGCCGGGGGDAGWLLGAARGGGPGSPGAWQRAPTGRGSIDTRRQSVPAPRGLGHRRDADRSCVNPAAAAAAAGRGVTEWGTACCEPAADGYTGSLLIGPTPPPNRDFRYYSPAAEGQ